MESQQKITNACLLALTFMGLTSSLIYTKSILVPLTFAFLFYETTIPLINFLCKKAKTPKFVSVLLSLGLIVAVIVTLIVILSSSIESFISGADLYREKIILGVQHVTDFIVGIGFEFDNKMILQEIRNLPIFSFAKKLTGGVASFLGNFALIIIFMMFMFAGETRVSKRSDFAREIHYKISRYVGTKLVLSLATGVFVWIILISMAVELAFMIGVLTFLLNFIPNVGSVIATILPLPILLLQFGLSWQTPMVLVICGVAQFVIGNIIEPKLLGESMDLHPLTVLIALLFWGLVWGIPGMFLSVPLTAIIKILFERFSPTVKLAHVMSGKWT